MIEDIGAMSQTDKTENSQLTLSITTSPQRYHRLNCDDLTCPHFSTNQSSHGRDATKDNSSLKSTFDWHSKNERSSTILKFFKPLLLLLHETEYQTWE